MSIETALRTWFVLGTDHDSWTLARRVAPELETDLLSSAIWTALRSGGILVSDVIGLREGRGESAPSDELGIFAAPDAVEQLLSRGLTARVLGIEGKSGQLEGLFDGLSASVDRPITGNVYVTAPGQSGSRVHTDPMDVVVVQLLGDKVWEVGGSRVVTQRGDVLSMRAGVPHAARGGSEVSMHLTCAVAGFHAAIG